MIHRRRSHLRVRIHSLTGALAISAAVVLGACAGGPMPEDGPGGPPVVRAPSVYGLIGERSRLDLTSEQIEALDSIGGWVAEQMEDTRYEVGQRTAAADSAALRANRDQIRQISEQVNAGVRAILTAEQQQTACDLERQRAERDGDRIDPRIRPGGDRRPAVRQGWSWCASDSAPDARV